MVRLNINKAYGMDCLPGIFDKRCASVLCSSSTKLFNVILDSGFIPLERKSANIVPIHKKRVNNLVENFRPVSLLCVISILLISLEI